MSTASEITRLTDARNTIRDKLIDLGLATSTSKLDALATAVDGIANRGAVSAQVQEGDTYTIPAGYHNGSGTVSGVAGGGADWGSSGGRYALKGGSGIVIIRNAR